MSEGVLHRQPAFGLAADMVMKSRAHQDAK
jgi:hypothetical protein